LINNAEKILILKRSNLVKTYKRLWGTVAGYVEEGEEPYKTAIREIREETGLMEKEVRFIRKGETIQFTDVDENVTYNWVVHPFLFSVEKNAKIKISWEHTNYKWIPPSEISKYKVVPHLTEIVSKMF
jgi:8-oxo-dGTP pyrophosphatase MutT (NUDIX family)